MFSFSSGDELQVILKWDSHLTEWLGVETAQKNLVLRENVIRSFEMAARWRIECQKQACSID